MKAFTQKQPTIYDLLQPGYYQDLVKAFSKFNITINPREIILNNQSKDKSSVLSKALGDLEIQFPQISKAHFTTKEDNDAASEKKNIEEMRIFSFLRGMLLNALTEEAVSTYIKQEKLKELQRELRLYILKLAEAEFSRQLYIAEAEKMKMAQMENELRALFSEDFHISFEEHKKDLSGFKLAIDGLNEELKVHKGKKDAIKAQLKIQSTNDAEKLIESNPSLKGLDPQSLGDFIFKCRNEYYKIQSSIEKYDTKDLQDAKADNEALVKLESLKIESDKIASKLGKGNGLFNKDRYPPRLPETTRITLEAEFAAIVAKQDLLKKEIDQRRINKENRNEKREQAEAQKARIFDKVKEKVSDPVLKKALDNPDVIKLINPVLENKSKLENDLLEVHKHKTSAKAKVKVIVKNAVEIENKNAKNISRIAAIDKTQHPKQSHNADDHHQKSEQIQEMCKHIKQVGKFVPVEEKAAKKEKKKAKRLGLN